MTLNTKILLFCLISTWTWGVNGVAKDTKDSVAPSSTPDFQQVIKEEIEVTPPSAVPQLFDDQVNVPKDHTKIKPRKGVTPEDGYSTNSVTSDTYKVKEVAEEVHDAAKQSDGASTSNNSASSSSSVTGKLSSDEKSSNTNNAGVVGKGSVTPIDQSQPVKPPDAPKKPKITYSPEDNPEVLKHAAKPNKIGGDVESSQSSKLPIPHIQSVDEPKSEFSTEYEQEDMNYGGFLGYIVISALVLTFIAVPVVFGRKLKDLWATRHYRRVDFLVDGMYE